VLLRLESRKIGITRLLSGNPAKEEGGHPGGRGLLIVIRLTLVCALYTGTELARDIGQTP
jgi:hypothetical protein